MRSGKFEDAMQSYWLPVDRRARILRRNIDTTAHGELSWCVQNAIEILLSSHESDRISSALARDIRHLSDDLPAMPRLRPDALEPVRLTAASWQFGREMQPGAMAIIDPDLDRALLPLGLNLNRQVNQWLIEAIDSLHQEQR